MQTLGDYWQHHQIGDQDLYGVAVLNELLP